MTRYGFHVLPPRPLWVVPVVSVVWIPVVPLGLTVVSPILTLVVPSVVPVVVLLRRVLELVVVVG